MVNIFDESMMGIMAEAEETAFRLHLGKGSGSISIKKIRGRKYVYLQKMRNKRQRCLYLGPAEDDKVIELIQRIQEKKKSAQEAKKRAAFFIKLLKGAGVIPVSGLAERVLRLLSEEELIFGNGMLIGTFAFLAYQTKLGFSIGFAPFSHDTTWKPIPEPATFLLVGTGLVLLGKLRNRKKLL